MSGRGREKKSPRSNVLLLVCTVHTDFFFFKKKRTLRWDMIEEVVKTLLSLWKLGGGRGGWNEPTSPFSLLTTQQPLHARRAIEKGG